MSLFRRYRWFVAAAGITLAFTVVSLIAHRSDALTAFSDLTGLALMLAATGATLANALTRPKQERSFWALMTLGFGLWVTNQAAWTYRECFVHLPIPDPFFYDIILFFHAVPMIAAIAWRPDLLKPDLLKKDGKILLSLLNFLMLLGWWIFLYAFIVFPHQYVVLNVPKYNVYYDRLYGLENGLLLVVLGLATWTGSGGWRRLYLHLLAASALYAVNSQFLDRAAADNVYYSGSPYDVPLIGTVAWIAAAAWSARGWELESVEFRLNPRWKKLVPRLAMLTILSLPVLGVWAALFDSSAAPSRVFRIFSVLVAMLLLGAFVFLRQYLQDQSLMVLLRESRRHYESQKRLQNQLVQKEKLASLGTLVAGAAHEIDLPLKAVMSYSEQLWAQARLSEEQSTLLRKIVSHAQRTRDLVANLLSFAQQAPGEKAPVDLGLLLTRAKQMMELRYPTGRIQAEISIAAGLPRVSGNANQLFQSFIEIIENAMDALEEAGGGGSLKITADCQGGDVVVQFSDTGLGIREPDRVFDPFYTTKPVGKGTGLGLSAVYGVVQDHGGQITCQNKPEGGALFVLKFPVATETAAQVAGAAGD
jgi:signal transduction histidine kinase